MERIKITDDDGGGGGGGGGGSVERSSPSCVKRHAAVGAAVRPRPCLPPPPIHLEACQPSRNTRGGGGGGGGGEREGGDKNRVECPRKL